MSPAPQGRRGRMTHPKSPRISLIAALDRRGVIGRGGRLPWHLPADLRRFRRLTVGKPVIMGRKTHESIGRPLPQRVNIVLTGTPGYEAPGCLVVHSLDDALAAAGEAEEVMVIGGARLFEQFLPRADRLYLTLIEAETAGEVFFPAFRRADWEEVFRESHEADAVHPYPYTFIVLERRQGGSRPGGRCPEAG